MPCPAAVIYIRESVAEGKISFNSNVQGGVLGRLSILFPPDLKLFPRCRRQLEKITEEGDTLGPRRQLVGGVILDGSDQIDGREDDGYSEHELRGVRWEFKGRHDRSPQVLLVSPMF